MTTNTITVEFGPRRGWLAVSAFPGIALMSEALVADRQKHKSTRVSVPGCRGVT